MQDISPYGLIYGGLSYNFGVVLPADSNIGNVFFFFSFCFLFKCELDRRFDVV